MTAQTTEIKGVPSVMSKKQMAAIVTAAVTVLSSFALALSGGSKADSVGERLRANEVRYEEIEKRLNRIEEKQDDLLKYMKGR